MALTVSRIPLNRADDKEYSELYIGDNIKITVKESNRCQVKFHIEAPVELEIWRGELYEAIQKQGNKRKGK
jgi:carbon storage regulator CsrA